MFLIEVKTTLIEHPEQNAILKEQYKIKFKEYLEVRCIWTQLWLLEISLSNIILKLKRFMLSDLNS